MPSSTEKGWKPNTVLGKHNAGKELLNKTGSEPVHDTAKGEAATEG